jgi:carboxypeptidase C (cathepsin A)
MRFGRVIIAVLVVSLLSLPAQAQRRGRGRAGEPPTAEQQTPASAPASRPSTSKEETDHLSVTEHEMSVHGQTLKYKATAGTLVVRDESGKAKANMFFVAYEKQSAPEDRSKRPITYLFNGGPGSSSVWLHLGAAGPKRVGLDDTGGPPAPPYHLLDNQDTWLAASDLVFIDPVGTGYSRPAAGEDPRQFYGVENDLRSVAQFIRLYTTRYERWESPKFLAGESYGTTRAAGLSNVLLEDGISVNGIVLISSVLNFQTLAVGRGGDLPYVVYLPSYTALAWYHKKLPADLQSDRAKAVAEAEKYALHDYLTDLAAGDKLAGEQRAAAVKKISRLTGLPERLVDRANLRISPGVFRKELLADQRKVIGRYDGRLSAFDLDPLGETPDYDPSYEPFLGAYSAMFNDYARRELKFETDMPYEVLSGRVRPWDMGAAGQGFLEVVERLRASLVGVPNLHVMFCSGMYDLATPYFATKHTVDHLDVGPQIPKNIRQTFYDAGHMVYQNRPDRENLTKNVEEFIRSSIPEQ